MTSGAEPDAGRWSRGQVLGWSLLLAVLLAPFLVPIPLSLERDRVIRALGNLVHVPLFFLVTWFLWRRGPLAGRLARAVTVAIAAGVAVEIVQELCGRHARLRDFALDLLGIGLAVCWLQFRRLRSRRFLVAGIVLLLVVAAQLAHLPAKILARKLAAARFPSLADFESPREEANWGENDGGVFAAVPAPGGCWVGQLRAGPPDRYPGFLLRGFPRDWSGFRYLEWRARVLDPARPGDVEFFLRLDDFRGLKDDSWASRKFQAGTDWRAYRVDLRELAAAGKPRPVDLADVYSVLFFVNRPAEPVFLQLDDLALR